MWRLLRHYDIRFIYHHEKEWYLSVFQQRDFIESMFVGDLDTGGWDIKKCLQLMHRGNAPLLEWLGSPIVYRKDEAKVNLLSELASRSFNPKVIYHHYMSLAKKKMAGDEFATNAKSFLYGFRALLCASWAADFNTMPPVEFRKLTNHYLDDDDLSVLVRNLLEAKKNQGEGDDVSVESALIGYSQTLSSKLSEADVKIFDVAQKDECDLVFRKIL